MLIIVVKVLHRINTTSVISKWGRFSLFSSLVILLLVLPSNFDCFRCEKFEIISCFCFEYNSIFYFIYLSDTEYDQSGNSNSSFHVGADVLNFLFLMALLYFPMYSKCYGLMKQHIYHSSTFYPKKLVILCENQMFCYSQNS